METDVLIIGSGIAGLSLAIKLAERNNNLKITIASKTSFIDSNSVLAQGGVAAVMDILEDSLESHIQDTLVAGDGLCKEDVVRAVVGQGFLRIRELIDWGWKPDSNINQKLDLAKEGGHSAHRVVHSKDHTGKTLVEVLLHKVSKYENVEKLENCLSLDLIVEDGKCAGATIHNLDTESAEVIKASKTVLAAGGAGQVYAVTTNPEVATGDGIAMGVRAGADVEFMEFVQFHPTAFFIPKQQGKSFLISEAVRGHGAILKHKGGEPFMSKYHNRGSLAPRDVVSRAISQEKANQKVSHVFLDCREIDEFPSLFPNINDYCLEQGINPKYDMIPVAPAAHYMCGGITTSINAETSIANLFAIGECAYTGLHGANRLASNSLLEALVFAHNCAAFLGDCPVIDKPTKSDAILRLEGSVKKDRAYSKVEWKVRKLMSAYAGIVRNDRGLEKALKKIVSLKEQLEASPNNLKDTPKHYRCKNLLDVAELILTHSLKRTENRGGFYKI